MLTGSRCVAQFGGHMKLLTLHATCDGVRPWVRVLVHAQLLQRAGTPAHKQLFTAALGCRCWHSVLEWCGLVQQPAV
jgi:hypothetical protein